MEPTWLSIANCRLLTGTIQKPMGRARGAKTHERPTQRSSGPMEPHPKIVRGDTELFRNLASRLTQEIDLPNQLRILSRHRRQYSIQAAANRPVHVIVDQHRRTFLRLQTLQGCFSYTGATIVIDQGPAEHLGQPPFQGPGLLDRSGTSNRLQVKVLQDIFSLVDISRAPADKPQKLTMPLPEGDNHRFLDSGGRRRGFSRWHSQALKISYPVSFGTEESPPAPLIQSVE